MFFRQKQKRIYLDYASATPVRPEVFDAMEPFFSLQYGNAGAIHKEGAAARIALEKSREEAARLLHVRPEGILFTGSGTESNNLALLGIIELEHMQGRRYEDMEVVSTKIEHASVLEVLAHLEKLGVAVRYVEIDEFGSIDTASFKESLTPKTVLVTFAYVNSEIGVIQQTSKLARIVRAYEKEKGVHILIHADGAQAPLWLPCALDMLMVDCLSLDAGKCYGPKGIGILAFRHGVVLKSFMFGGSQEKGLRPGTENIPLIVGAVKALNIAQEHYQARGEKISKLRDAFIEQLETIDGLVLNGHRNQRVANNVNVSIPGIDSEFAVIVLDEKGIASSTKSACGGARGDGSSVVRMITSDDARATSTLRFSLGEDTTFSELAIVVQELKNHIEKTRTAAKQFA